MIEYESFVGRAFTGIGGNDCLQMVMDFYAKNFGILIPPFARPTDWKSDDLDLLRLLPPTCGFETITDWKVKDLRPGDLLAVAIGESNPNHLIIYLGEGEHQLLHHLYGRRSDAVPWRDFWRNQTCFVLRHPDVPDLRPVYPDVTIKELLDARNAPPSR